ncbi:MAG: VOC family protein [Planctomycetes bacterium]|nr:VOC family protein [Planctomycetota bacterium]
MNAPTPNLNTVELKAFVPARDFARSLAFYQALGFEQRFSDGEVAYLCHGNCPFLLQSFCVPEIGSTSMMHLLVQDVRAWHAHVLASGVREQFGVSVGELKDQPWAMREFQMTDPAGVLWSIAQNLPRVGD